MCCSPVLPLRAHRLFFPRIGLVVNRISIRRFCDQIDVLHIFDQTCIVLNSGSSGKMGPPDHYFRSFVSVSPLDATAKPMASSHHFSPLAKCQRVWRRLCEALRSSSLAGLKRPPLLPRLVLNVRIMKFVLLGTWTLNGSRYLRTLWTRSKRRSQFEHGHRRRADRAPKITASLARDRQWAH